MSVMDAMRYHPVDGAAFKRKRAAHAQKIFDQLWCLVSAMRQQSVITHADAQAGGDPPEHERNYQSLPTEHEERCNRAKMKQPHENGGVPVNTLRPFLDHLFVIHIRLSVPYQLQPFPL